MDPCLKANGVAHRTDRFDLKNAVLVVRRGQPFKFKVSCDRPFDENRDVISFKLSVNDHEDIVLHLPDGGDKSDWKAILDSVKKNVLTISIRASAIAPVSKWKITIDTKLRGSEQQEEAFVNASNSFEFYLLFNPWCDDDYVFLKGL